MTISRVTSLDALTVLAQHDTPILAQIAVKFALLVTTWATRRRTRAALAQLQPWQLRDVGLTQPEADREAARLFWLP